ncbi:MAG: GNAT family N-acetyltransferase [Boseongicola sp.]|nr:GNAT family N-acetyltransferase [Boseongicola sp.]MDD9976770.1 GNAT family N-acetyltransferase [Boseongicola sp.]
MIIRPGKPSDSIRVTEIMNPIIRDTTISFKREEWTIDDAEALVSGSPAFFVGEVEGRVQGFAYFDQFRKASGYDRAMEQSVMLAPEARGTGMGKALVAELEREAQRQGKGSLWGAISAENQAGVAFHASLGFEKIAVLPRVGFKFGRWLDLVLMQKWIAEEGDDPKGSD